MLVFILAHLRLRPISMRLCQAYSPERSNAHSVLISVSFHGALLLGLLIIPMRQLADPEPETSIKVDVISFDVLRSIQATSNQRAKSSGAAVELSNDGDLAQSDSPSPPSSVKPAYGTLIRPTTMLSGSALARKGNAEARGDLAGITPEERREQLCALEALEQIHAWNEAYIPERMVSYSFDEVRYEGPRIIADGATFWSKDNWHRLKFECEVSDDLQRVLDFAFFVGVIVPKDQWERHNLTKYK
ncbi:DUF930 domain-containing protein [Cohaesibacter celericrescens]|uniref:DUF930 domain-containing protein n=1 Tax=Cohaesibacter celericrescens TaxID=2067669 RepID=UPI003564A5C0